MKKVMLTMLLAFLSVSMFAQVPVTFRVKLGAAIYKKLFDPAKDSICVRGDFQTDAGDAGNWGGFKFKLTDPDKDSVYTLTVNFPSARIDSTYQYKFVKGPDNWEGGDNKTFKLKGPSMTLPASWFNNDSTYKVITMVTNTVKFTADVAYMWGQGVGSFDPTTDSLQLMGLDWDNLGTLISPVSARTMKIASPLTPKIYTTTLQFKGVLGDSTKYKFKAFPDANYNNGGWETGSDRWIKYIADGSSTTLPTVVPAIDPVGVALKAPVTVYFQCDMKGAVNAWNKKPIDPATVDWVGLRGGNKYIGSWTSGGAWNASDTTGFSKDDTTAFMRVLKDDGKNGDEVAKDYKFVLKVVFPKGTYGGGIEYKFGAHYPGADTVNNSTTPLDNELGFQVNHKFTLKDATAPVWIRMKFGDATTEVRQIENSVPKSFELSQNFPNPFNPSTVIKYTVPEAGLVTLKIHNLLGQEVAELVNQAQTPGTYTATFEANRLATGIYFYTLNTGKFTATKKMMLIK